MYLQSERWIISGALLDYSYISRVFNTFYGKSVPFFLTQLPLPYCSTNQSGLKFPSPIFLGGLY